MGALLLAATVIITSIGWIWYFVFSHKPNSQFDDASFAVQKKDYKKDIVYLYTFRPSKGLILSPFALKLVSFLKYSKIPFESVPGDHFGKTPKGKLPVIELNGQVHSDTDRIVALLKQHFTDIDADLSPIEKSTSLAIIRMAEEHLYWACVYFRWIEDSGAKQFASLVMNSFFLKNVIFPFIRAQVRKSLWGHGLGRHKESDILQFARDCR